MNVGFNPNRKATKLTRWMEQHFPDPEGRPCNRTMKKAIDDPNNTQVQGYNIGSRYFIYLDTEPDEELQELVQELVAA